MRLLLAAISFSILSALAGCVAMSPSPPVAGEGDSDSDSDKGYQFGDISKALLQRQRDYCIETSPVLRAVGLALIRSKFLAIRLLVCVLMLRRNLLKN